MPTCRREEERADLEGLAVRLCRSIAAGEYERAQAAADACVALASAENYEAVLGVLRRAEQIAMVRRAFLAKRASDVKTASSYLQAGDRRPHHLVTG